MNTSTSVEEIVSPNQVNNNKIVSDITEFRWLLFNPFTHKTIHVHVRANTFTEWCFFGVQDSYNPKRLTVKLVQSSSTYNYNDAVDAPLDSSPEGEPYRGVTHM